MLRISNQYQLSRESKVIIGLYDVTVITEDQGILGEVIHFSKALKCIQRDDKVKRWKLGMVRVRNEVLVTVLLVAVTTAGGGGCGGEV